MFYGSQTGTAEEFANRLSKDAHRYGMRGMAADPEEYDLVSARRAPAPSSRAVRSRVLRQARWDRGDRRAELGKGTGGIGHLLSFVPAARQPPDIKNPWPRCVQVRCLRLSMLQAPQALGRCPQKGPGHLVDWVWLKR